MSMVPPARSIRVGAEVSMTTMLIIGSSHFSLLRARFVFMFGSPFGVRCSVFAQRTRTEHEPEHEPRSMNLEA
jgi:hypothetical protein